MDRQKTFDEPLTELERSLAALKPKAGSLDRERLMFLAGQASVAVPRDRAQKAARRWRSATAVTTLVAIGLAVVAVAGPKPADRLVDRKAPEVPSPTQHATTPQSRLSDARVVPEAGDDPGRTNIESRSSEANDTSGPESESPNYLTMRQIALARGVDALPLPHGRAANELPRLSREQLLDELLEPSQGLAGQGG
jgi:hypothetical protein